MSDSERIRREIERTRAEMDQTLDALNQRLRPANLIGETRRGREIVQGVARVLWRDFRANPLPFALIAAGLVWLALSDPPRRPRRRVIPHPPLTATTPPRLEALP